MLLFSWIFFLHAKYNVHSCLEHKTSDWVRSKIDLIVNPWAPSLATVKRRKLATLEHVTHHDVFNFTSTNLLTERVVGAPQMTSQPVLPIFFLLLFSTTLWDLANSSPVHFLQVVSPLLLLSVLSSSPFHCVLQDGSGQT